MRLDSSGRDFPRIVEAHLLIRPRHWRTFTAGLKKTLLRLRDAGTCLLPLYFSHDIEDFEVRICFLLDGDPEHLERYVVRHVRSLRGVSATRVRLTLTGTIFPDGLKALLSGGPNRVSAHVFLKCSPNADGQAWRRLVRLKKVSGVYPTWVFRDFYEYDRDMTLRLMGPSVKAIRGYVEEFVSPIPGMELIRLQVMRDLVRIMDAASISRLAKRFVETRMAGRARR